jgi:superfamily II DNA or RNA helicase
MGRIVTGRQDVTERRRFNRGERVALYLAADGRCSRCGADLEPGWHADHMHPHSRGGPTDVINGQALCPRCNLQKGASVLREWQQRAKEKFLACGKPDFLLSATPGAGKTRFALDLARDLLTAGQIERVIVVVPSDTLRQQWADQGDSYGIPLMPVSDPADYDKTGYRGCVITYQQLRYGAASVRRVTRVPTLAILDEIHHAGQGRMWGDDLREAAGNATYRLALTGTPWRRDKVSPMPFVEYDGDGKVIVDYAYEYGEAVADGVCRPIEFHAYDGNANWRDPALPDPLVSVDLTEVATDDVGIALSTVFAKGSPWITTLLRQGASALDALRVDVPDAGGLVIADDQRLAEEYAAELQRITGERPELATSDIPGAKDAIDRFRAPGASARWIVAVRMVSEGVDIPRLAVGVYATRARTPLLFRQITGRFVRMRSEGDPNSLLFIPAIREFVELARQVEDELRHQLDEQIERERAERQEPLEFREGISASEATLDRAILKGQDVSSDELRTAEAQCRRYGMAPSNAVAVARMLRDHGHQGTPAEPVVIAPSQPALHRQERLLRQEVEKLSRKIAHRTGFEVREVNAELLRSGFPRRKDASVDDLQAMRQFLTKWLADL